MRRFLFTSLLLGTAMLANAQGTPPDVPEKIKAPSGEQVVLQVHATGWQIYVCQQDPYQRYGWVLKAPDAELHDAKGAVVGHHFAGPSWKLDDGSTVTGKAVGKADSPDPNSIPWLLVNVVSHSGEGTLSKVTSIQRINTKGGLPPANNQCTSVNQGGEAKSPYTADYYFYAPAK